MMRRGRRRDSKKNEKKIRLKVLRLERKGKGDSLIHRREIVINFLVV